MICPDFLFLSSHSLLLSRAQAAGNRGELPVHLSLLLSLPLCQIEAPPDVVSLTCASSCPAHPCNQTQPVIWRCCRCPRLLPSTRRHRPCPPRGAEASSAPAGRAGGSSGPPRAASSAQRQCCYLQGRMQERNEMGIAWWLPGRDSEGITNGVRSQCSK